MQDFFKKSFLFLIFFLPWQVALNLGTGIDLASGRVLIALLFLVWLTFQFLRKKVVVPSDFVSISLYGFVFCMIFSVFFSREIEWSLRKSLFLLSIFPIIFLAEFFSEERNRGEDLLKVIVVSSFGIAMLGVLQFFSQFFLGQETVYAFWASHIATPFLGRTFSEAVLSNPSWLVEISGKAWLRATATFPDPHMLSFFLNLSIGANIALIIKRRSVFFWRISLGMLVLANLLTFSRGGYLGFFMAGMVSLVYFFIKMSTSQRIRLAGILMGVVIVLAMISPIRERFSSSFNLREGSNVGRLETWKEAWNIWEKNFPFGVGIGSYPLFVKATADYREPIYAHNTYLDIALDGGLLAVIFWIGAVWGGIIRALRGASKEPWRIGLAFGLVAFSIHSFFDTPLYSVTVLPMLLLMLYLTRNRPTEKK